MPKLKYGLGRGLDALLESPSEDPPPQSEAASVVMVSLDFLKPNPRQPRKDFDVESLKELADSIREHGLIQPVIAERAGSESYFVIAGERRVRAARLAGLSEIPVIVREVSDQGRLALALIENIQREDLNPLEEAEAYAELMRLEGLSQEEAAERVGKSRPAVANALRLLKLPADMRAALERGSMTAGHARALLSVVNPADRQELFRRIESEHLSVRECESLSASLNGGKGKAPHEASKKRKRAAAIDPDLLALQERLIEMLGTKVSIRGNVSKGAIEISYFSQEDLGRLCDFLGKAFPRDGDEP